MRSATSSPGAAASVSWTMGLRQTAPAGLGLAATYGIGLAALRWVVADELGGPFWSPAFGALAAAAVLTALLVWLLLAQAARQPARGQAAVTSIKWAILGAIVFLLWITLVDRDRVLVDLFGPFIAPDLLVLP